MTVFFLITVKNPKLCVATSRKKWNWISNKEEWSLDESIFKHKNKNENAKGNILIFQSTIAEIVRAKRILQSMKCSTNRVIFLLAQKNLTTNIPFLQIRFEFHFLILLKISEKQFLSILHTVQKWSNTFKTL